MSVNSKMLPAVVLNFLFKTEDVGCSAPQGK
jgi:hypothetical protein